MSLTNVGARLGLYVCDLVKLGEAVGSCVGVFLLLSGALLLFELVDSTNKILSIEYAIVGFPVGLADLKEVVARKVGFLDLADGVKLGFLDAVVEGIIVVFFETTSDGEKVETILVLVGITDGALDRGVKLGFLDAVVEGIIVVFFETTSDGEKVETILVLVGITDGALDRGLKLGFLDAIVEGIIVVFFETACDGEKVETILVLVGITDGDRTIGAAELCRSLNEDVADKISVDFLEGSEVETFSVARNFTFCEVSVLNISAAVKILK